MTEGSACFDLRTVDQKVLNVGYAETVHTGLSVELPRGYILEVRPRSGLSIQGITIPNSPGTIDSDYRGEIKVLLISSRVQYKLNPGDRIAQARLVREIPTEFTEVEELSETERGSGGFGSTGV